MARPDQNSRETATGIDVLDEWRLIEPGNALAVRVLGPLEVAVGGRPVLVTAARLRTLLVTLAMSAGTTVSVNRLATAVWGESLPDHTRASLQTYVNRLRGALGPDSIATRPDGYLLRAQPDDVDALLFARLLDAAARAPEAEAERALLDEALSLWRGTPFEDVRSAWLERSEYPRLLERYLGGLERRTDLDIAAGRHGELVAQLRELTARYPLREPLSARLLVVLARCGQQAEALRRYETIRRHLAQELGVDPGPELRGVYAELLRDKTPRRPGENGTAPARRVVPRQLPADIDGLTGRDAALQALSDLIPDGQDVAGSPTAIAVIAGGAGVGKTALSVHWAHQVADRFPDGQLYVNLRGYDPVGSPTPPAQAIRGFLDALGVPASQIPASFQAQAGLYRSLLAGRRILIVLDNARDAEQVRPLLPGASGCLVVVTSRDQLPGLVAAEGARPVILDPLTLDDARRLLAHRLGTDRVAAEPGAVDEIIDRCGRLPLALAIVAARAVTHPSFSLAALADQLRTSGSHLDGFATGDATTDVRTVFSRSYRTLGAPAARLFGLLGLHPGADFTAPAAASLAGLPVREVRTLLAELTRAHLITEHVPGRYTFHDLLRAYAVELVHTDTLVTGDQRREATHRVLDHYLYTAHTAALLVYPQDPIALPPAPAAVTPEDLADHGQAMTWFAAEHPALLAAIDQAAGAEFDTHVWQLAWTLSSFLDWQGHWHDQAVTQRKALAAALRLGDRPGLARTLAGLARVHIRLSRYDDAHRHLNHALDLYTQLGDQTGQARTHLDLGQFFGRQGEEARSLEHNLRALTLYRATRHRAGQAAALSRMGWSYALLGEHLRAIACCRQALTLLTELGHRHEQATTWDSLGYAYHDLGRSRQATVCYQRAFALYRDLGDRYRQAETLIRLGDTHKAAYEHDSARRLWRQALEILDGLGHTSADSVRGKLQGLTGCCDEARVA